MPKWTELVYLINNFQHECEHCHHRHARELPPSSRAGHLGIPELCKFALEPSSTYGRCTIETDVLKDPTGELYQTCRQV